MSKVAGLQPAKIAAYLVSIGWLLCLALLYGWRFLNKISLAGGGSRIFFRRGCTRPLLYFNTNKPHSFFFWQNTSCIRKLQVISGGGRGVRTPCTLPLDPSLPGLAAYFDNSVIYFQNFPTTLMEREIRKLLSFAKSSIAS